jgi:hypothetical protein
MPKEMAGQEDLVAAAGAEHILLEPGDVDRHHHDFCEQSLLAGSRGSCRLRPILDKVPAMLRGGSMLRVLVMAISIAPALLMLAVLALERWGDRPPLAAAHQSAARLDWERRHRADHRLVVAALADAAVMAEGINSSS